MPANMEQANPHRQGRIAELLQRTVGEIILNEAGIESTMLTVSSVVLSPNHQHVTIVISVFPENKKEEAMSLLKEKTWAIQQALNKKLRMRPVPKIRFELDNSEEQARKILDILDKN